MAISKEKIEQIYTYNKAIKQLLEEESKAYKKATEKKDTKVMVEREGKQIEITEAELWEEVRVAGAKCEGGEILMKKYPKVFKIALKREDQAEELYNYVQKEFGFDFRAMTMADYMELTEALIDYKLEKNGTVTK